jgi:photosystem II stability/assembly factor-like uncharacterized protein
MSYIVGSNCIKKLLILLVAIVILLGSGNNAHAATNNQWATTTPAGISSCTFNTVSAIGNYVYLGTSCGVYKSTDGGNNWSQINTGLGSHLNVTSISIGWTTFSYGVTSSSLVFVATADGVYAVLPIPMFPILLLIKVKLHREVSPIYTPLRQVVCS